MNWGTRDSQGQFLCNFVPRVVFLDKVYTDTSNRIVDTVRFCLDFGDGNIENEKVYSFPVDFIDDIPWEKLDKRCIYEPNVPKKKVARYLGYSVRRALELALVRSVYKVNRAGMHTVNGKPILYTGVEIISSSDTDTTIIFETEQVSQKLEVDEKLTEEEAAAEFFRLLCLSPNPGQVMLSYKLVFFMRLAYVSIGKVPKGCIYLYGQSGTQKTTFSSFLVQTYDRSSEIRSPSRLNATIPAVVNMLLENPNDVVVMDDLFPADSNRIKNQQEEMLIEITRYIADGTVPTRMRGKELSRESPKCGVIFTGEYLIGRGSDAARILPVEMTKPDTKKLQYFQEHPLIVSTFYRNYITWFIYHYDEICDILKQLLETYENNAPCVHDRLREMYFFLGSSYLLFLQYLFEIKLLSKANARRLYQSFDELLVMLINQQNERVNGKGSEKFENEDYLQRIRTLYNTGQISIASDTETFDKEQHDGLLHRNRLYLRRDRLPAYFPDSTIEDIAGSLEAQGALETGKKSRTKQINRLNGMRFYVILLRYLN